MKKSLWLILPLALITTTGCQGFAGRLGLQERAAPEAPDMTSYFAQLIEDGRRHLEAQRPTAAITSFRQASYHANYAGEAFNGMAIAYDRIGRYDLAERFFAQAVESAPEDARFARNAARFEAIMFARQSTAAGAQLAAEGGQASPTPVSEENFASAAIALDTELAPVPEGRMQRVSSREVVIASRDDWPTRLVAGENARPAVYHVGNSETGDRILSAAGPEYPIRIELASTPAVQGDIVDGEWSPRSGSRFVDRQGSASIRVSGLIQPPTRPSYPVTVTLDPPS